MQPATHRLGLRALPERVAPARVLDPRDLGVPCGGGARVLTERFGHSSPAQDHRPALESSSHLPGAVARARNRPLVTDRVRQKRDKLVQARQVVERQARDLRELAACLRIEWFAPVRPGTLTN